MANKWIGNGNIVRDPERVENKKDLDIARFSIAINKKGKNPRTDFFDVTAFGHTANNVLEYKKKGDPILVEGRLQQETWADKETGKQRSKVSIVADQVEFLGRGGEDNANAASGDTNETTDIPF